MFFFGFKVLIKVDVIDRQQMREEIEKQVQAALSEITRRGLHHHRQRQTSTLAPEDS